MASPSPHPIWCKAQFQRPFRTVLVHLLSSVHCFWRCLCVYTLLSKADVKRKNIPVGCFKQCLQRVEWSPYLNTWRFNASHKLMSLTKQHCDLSVQVFRITVLSVGLLSPKPFYQNKVAKDIGCKHLLEAIGSNLFTLGQHSFSCREYMNRFSETVEDNCMTF